MRKIPPPYTDPAPLFRHGGVSPADRSTLLDFSASINPLGPPASVLKAIREALPSIAHYPDPDCRELTEKLAAIHGVAVNQIVVGNGSNELIYAIARAFRPKRVAIAEPTYTEYLRASLLVGAEVDHWLAEGNDFKLRPFDAQGVDLVWLCNPNNPTGGMWPRAAHLARWMKRHPDTIFAVDEAFMPLSVPAFLSRRDFPRSMIPPPEPLDNLIVLRSLTKSYSLPGVRLGFAVTTPELASAIRRQRVPWSVNQLAQTAGLAALRDDAFWYATHNWFVENSGLASELKAISNRLRPVPSATNFVLVRLKGIDAKTLTGCLEERGILVRNASNFVGLDERYIRVAVRSRKDNQRLANELAEILEGEPCPAL